MTVSSMDTLKLERAETLARKIARYWRNRGFGHVRAWVEPVTVKECTRSGALRPVEIFQVRSNLVNGLPPRVEEIAVAA